MFNNKSESHEDVAPSHSECWGKTKDNLPWLTVKNHCLYVGRVAQYILSIMPECKKVFVPEGSITLIACHDVGKVSPGFQQKNDTWSKDKAPYLVKQGYYDPYHTSMSYSALMKYTGLRTLGEVCCSHHGRGYQRFQKHYDVHDKAGGVKWSEERAKFIKDMEDEFGPLPNRDLTEAEKITVSGLMVVSDWLGSNSDIFFDAELDEEYVQEAMQQLGFTFGGVKKNLKFKDLYPFSPNNLQQKVIEQYSGRGVYVIESETGSGKTEAAFYLAYKLIEEEYNSGFSFLLPTQVTSNRMYKRAEKFIKKISDTSSNSAVPQLVHGNAWLESSYVDGLNIPETWFSPNKRSLLAQYGIGTVDQALLSILNCIHSTVRLYGLAGKVVILDEIHSYDVYTGTIIDELIEVLVGLNCSVIILSATLTQKRRKELLRLNVKFESVNDYPLLSILDNNVLREEYVTQNKDIDVHINFNVLPSERNDKLEPYRRFLLEREAQEVYERAKLGQNVLWLRNTVPKVQSAYNHLSNLISKEDGIELVALHAYFPQYIRNKREDIWMEKLGKKVRKRPVGSIVVSTQVVEQSVDIDADYIVTDLAPMDIILQRIGRLWRFDMDGRGCFKPEIKISTYNFFRAKSIEDIRSMCEGDANIYDPYVLYKTFLVLYDVEGVINIPKDVRLLLEKTYDGDHSRTPLLDDLFEESFTRIRNYKSKALGSTSDGFQKTVAHNVVTRWNHVPYYKILIVKKYEQTENTISATLLNDVEITVDLTDWKKNKSSSVARELSKTAVKIIYTYIEPFEASLAHDALSRYFYEPLYICIIDDDKLFTLDYVDTNLRYFDTIGLQYRSLL